MASVPLYTRAVDDLLRALFLALLGIVPCAMLLRGFEARERSLLMASYGLHVVGAVANVVLALYVYRGGDMLWYTRSGRDMASLMGYAFGDFAPEVLKLLFQKPVMLPLPDLGAGTSTGSMHGLTGIICFLTGGALYTANMAVALPAFFGKLFAYRVLRDAFPEYLRMRVLCAVMLVPTVILWSSGLFKESVAIAGLGLLIYGVPRFLQHRRVSSLLHIALGATIVSLFKPYILFAFVLGMGAWFYADRATKHGTVALRFRPMHLVLGGALALGGVIGLGKLFPTFALDKVAEQAAHLQWAGQLAPGGSTYEMGNAEARTLSGQLVYAPWALVSALFRPFFFEVRNPQMLANALETTVLLWLSGRALLTRGKVWLWKAITGSPWLVFSVTFIVTFGVAVGLATTNLGTLSRYRMPLVPFLTLIVLVTTAPAPAPANVTSRRSPRELVPRRATP